MFIKSYSTLLNYVPKHLPPSLKDIEAIKEFIDTSKRLLIVTGAGISTESGIPDYRSEGVGMYARTNHKPIQYIDFLQHAEVRKRYWARNYIGFERFQQIEPNVTHHTLRELEARRRDLTIITQNVDNLHRKAGSVRVIELHGNGYNVLCLRCNHFSSRRDLQRRIVALNPHMNDFGITKMIRPDGDVDIPQEYVDRFTPPNCAQCGGILKPDIVFFGDSVPKERVLKVNEAIEHCDALLVLGSSLTVFSSYRIALQAHESGKRLAAVNIGATRADKLLHLKIDAKCGDILPKACH